MKTLEERKARLAELAKSDELFIHIDEQEALELMLASLELGHLLEPTCFLEMKRNVLCKNMYVMFQVQEDYTIHMLQTEDLVKFLKEVEKKIQELDIPLPPQE